MSPIHRLFLVESQVHSGTLRYGGGTLSEDSRRSFRLRFEAELDSDATWMDLHSMVAQRVETDKQ